MRFDECYRSFIIIFEDNFQWGIPKLVDTHEISLAAPLKMLGDNAFTFYMEQFIDVNLSMQNFSGFQKIFEKVLVHGLIPNRVPRAYE